MGSRSPPLCNYVIVALAAPLIYNALVCINQVTCVQFWSEIDQVQYLVTSISSSSERFYKTPDKDTTKRAKRHNFDADSKANLEVKRKARSDTPDFERLKIFDPEVAQKYYNDDEKLLNEFRTRDLTSLPNEGNLTSVSNAKQAWYSIITLLDFIFHNKMPKCGGSTMNAILTQLSEWNDFNFVRLQANFSQFDLNEQFSRDLETIRNRVSWLY